MEEFISCPDKTVVSLFNIINSFSRIQSKTIFLKISLVFDCIFMCGFVGPWRTRRAAQMTPLCLGLAANGVDGPELTGKVGSEVPKCGISRKL